MDTPPPPPRYNLCMRTNDSINSIIFKETLNVQQTTNGPLHQGRYSIATKTMQIKETYKFDMYLPVGRFAGVVVDDETGKALEYQDFICHEKYKETWSKAFVKEMNQLVQGICDYCPQKADLNRVRLAVGDDCIDYPWDVSTPTANLVTSKILMNSMISTPGAKFMTADIKTFI
eukprot:10411300-Ditylum_brightwellii.AAC.1